MDRRAAGLDKKIHQERGMQWVLERETAPTIGSEGGGICVRRNGDWVKPYFMLGAIVSNFKGKTLVVGAASGTSRTMEVCHSKVLQTHPARLSRICCEECRP